MTKKVLDNELCYSLTLFILENKGKDNVFEIYNRWVDKEKVNLDYQAAIWALGYIPSVQKCDEALIREALKIDKRNIEKGRYGKGWNR